MAATTDIRFKRTQREYQTLHDAQDETLDKVDSIEAALLGLTEAVNQNSRDIAEVRQMLQAIIEHQNVPYKPMGFLSE